MYNKGMKTNLIDDVLSDFKKIDPIDAESLSYSNISVRLPAKYKASYDRLQEQSGRRLSKKVREVLMALLDAAEAKAS
jgi:hypothetical protein